MSEYQYIASRAIDGPAIAENLKFMERQSSRAEITPWTFDNEYHYGDFHGDAAGIFDAAMTSTCTTRITGVAR